MIWTDLLPDGAAAWVRVLTFLPLVICSVIGFALTLLKWAQTRQPTFARPETFIQVGEAVKVGRLETARELAHADHSRGGQLVEAVLAQAGHRRAVVKDRAEQAGKEIVQELEAGLDGLALIATLGPLFGLLGTVVGIILVFSELSATGGGATPQDLAGGIGTALYTTVAGLIVGVLALVSHRYLVTHLGRRISQLEAVGLGTVDLLCEEASCVSDRRTE